MRGVVISTTGMDHVVWKRAEHFTMTHDSLRMMLFQDDDAAMRVGVIKCD